MARDLEAAGLPDPSVRNGPAVLGLYGRGKTMEGFAVDGDGERGGSAIAQHLARVGETHIEVQRYYPLNLQSEIRVQSPKSPFLSGAAGKKRAHHVEGRVRVGPRHNHNR